MPARLNVVSPLPPVPSEVANHTMLVADALGEWADVTLWTPETGQPHAATRLPVVRFDPASMDWPRLHRADATIYNIGNNATFHRAVFDVARQAPGIVVLHDTRLQHFFARYAEVPGPGRTFYLGALRRCHGPDAVTAAVKWLAREAPLDTLVERYPMTEAAVEGALAAVVHHGAERDRLAGSARCPVVHLPLAFKAGPAPLRPAPGDTLRLVIFGFLGGNRRIGPVLEVLAAVPDRAIRLDIYGVLEEPDAVQRQIAAAGLAGRAVCHGFVPEPVLREALLRADLAINLRNPSMGEASGSQLRIWDAGLPSVVSRTGWYAALPDGSVFFAGPDGEAEMLAAHLAAFRRDPAPYRAAGLRGRAEVATVHTPERYARGLLDIVAQLPALHARRNAFGLSRVAARHLAELAGVRGVALGAEAVGAALGGWG